MNPINKRIAECIETLGITKTHFANKVNVSQAFVSQMTKGVSTPSDRTISDICRVFNVSERWLRTGEGEMFRDISEEEKLEQIFSEITVSDDDLIKRFIRAYWGLSDNEKTAIRKLMDGFAASADKEPTGAPLQPISLVAVDNTTESEDEAHQRRMATPFAARGGGLQRSNETRARHLKALEEDIRRKRERGELD